MEVLSDARIDASVVESNSKEVIKFERKGHFVRNRQSTSQKLVFNRTVGLRDTFAKEYAKG